MADILGQFFGGGGGGDSPFGAGHPFSSFGGLFGHSMNGGARNRRRKGEDVVHPLK